jgi:hypothetical protein
MQRERGSYVDEMLTISMPVIEKILSMESSEAVLNIEDVLVHKIDKSIQRAYEDVNSYRNKELVHQLLFWWKQWKMLKPILTEGWDMQRARALALASMTYLKALSEIHEEIRARIIREKKLRYWPGVPMHASVKEVLRGLKKNRSATIKQLYQLIKQALLLEQDHHKQEAITEFFCIIASSDYRIAIPFLDVMGYEEKEYKDLGILCIFSKCPLEHIRACFPLMTQFSNQESLEEGLKTLFNSCVDDEPELAMTLIKKMSTRAQRNNSLGLLALAYARKGSLDRAQACADMITSVTAKSKIDEEIESYRLDDRPLVQIQDLMKLY